MCAVICDGDDEAELLIPSGSWMFSCSSSSQKGEAAWDVSEKAKGSVKSSVQSADTGDSFTKREISSVWMGRYYSNHYKLCALL